jgi:hypothetical protein
MSTALATRINLKGWGGLDQTDLVLPSWRIIQPVSKAKGPQGHFVNNLTTQTAETLSFVILRVDRVRALWGKDLAQQIPLCSSPDGVHPRQAGIEIGSTTIPTFCAGCSFATWQQGEKPSCQLGYLYLCQASDGKRFLLRAMGTSVRPAKILNTLLITQGLPSFGAWVKAGTSFVQDTKGKYYILTFSIERTMTPEEWLPFEEASDALSGVAVQESEGGEGQAQTAPPAEDDDVPW